MRRRDLAIALGVGLVAVNLPGLLRRPTPFEFMPLPGFAGFRQLRRGSATATASILAGIDTGGPTLEFTAPCEVLFGADGWGEKLPVAVFSDVNCPNCLALEKRLFRLIEGGAPIRLIWHELPLLGPASARAAKATLAAARQGAHEAVHADLTGRVLRPGPAGLRDLAERHGLDAGQLIADAGSFDIERELEQNLALGRALGIPGTPGMVMGRTLVVGALNIDDLERLIEVEMSEPFEGCMG